MHHQPFRLSTRQPVDKSAFTFGTIEITWPLKCGESVYQNTNSNLKKKGKDFYHGNDIKQMEKLRMIHIMNK